jgi:hypothetical protein
MLCQPHIIIRERTNIIPIIKNTSVCPNIKQYSLKQNYFDPLKNSPPNEFMIKLYMRMSQYNSNHMKDDSRESE